MVTKAEEKLRNAIPSIKSVLHLVEGFVLCLSTSSLPRSSSRVVCNTPTKKALLSSNSCILELRLDLAIFSREEEHGQSCNIPNTEHFFPP